MSNSKFIILGIESSCDETAASVYSTDKGVLSNVLFSQIELHKKFGGVVPEIASRSHLEKINGIIDEALSVAKISLYAIDAIAVTTKPGLPGSLLVGVGFAKAIAFAKNKKIISVNHLEAHAFSASIDNEIPFPYLCITASGGHTAMYIVRDYGVYETIGNTLDDAAGEAFDKVAKLIHLPYPGGPVIEKLAAEVNFKDYFEYPRSKQSTLDFSFSGLKTAVLYDLVKRGAYNLTEKLFLLDHDQELKKQVASSLLVCITDIFEQKITLALRQYPEVKALAFVGGVACNRYIKNRLTSFATKRSLPFFSPVPAYCTDNAAMVAFVGHYKALKGEFSDQSIDIF